ncbi:Hint domain-containing protein [Thalassomonas sp. RHCl1]|uniref:Hint domain-containing protein n=1 Tax=Thalassomonas sp. RHCl1 TaxID=2995320 RepID=UPI00248CF91A|nr:Hint domain-containing protein [Thalassomonas sp. RHCl1]
MKKTYLKVLMPMALALAVSHNLQASTGATLSPITIADPAQKIQVERNEDGVRRLDMTNPSHYKLVKQRLAQAGKDSALFPQLHKTLDVQKTQQLKQKALSGKTYEINTAIDETQLDLIKNAHLFLEYNVGVSEDNNEPYLLIRAKSSVYGGTKQTYIDLLLEDGNGNTLAPMGSTFNVLDGKNTLATSQVRLSTLKQQFPNLETIYASSYVETEAADGTITSALKYTEYPFSWDHIDSLYPQAASAKDGGKTLSSVTVLSDGKPTYTPKAPVDVNTDGVIKVCLNRNHADCDYAADQYLDPNEITDVNIPFDGEIRIPHEIAEIYPTDLAPENRPNGVDELTNIYLQEGNYGGATKQSYLGLDNSIKNFSDYISAPEVVTNPDGSKETILRWNIPRDEGRFGNAKLFSNIAEANWYITFAASGWPYFNHGRGGAAQPFQVSITSEAATRFGNYYSPVLPKIKLGYSCLAKGTMITMADGKQRPIEKILAGDMVKGAVANNPATAQPMKVVDVSIGIEALQMIRITQANGQELLVTETHPVSTSNKGIVWAKELEEGDRVLTETGSALITMVEREKYNDKVYNLKLEPMEGANIAEGSYLGMFAGHTLLGDLSTQDEHNYKDQYIRESSEEILERLDEKWKTDYINSLK